MLQSAWDNPEMGSDVLHLRIKILQPNSRRKANCIGRYVLKLPWAIMVGHLRTDNHTVHSALVKFVACMNSSV